MATKVPPAFVVRPLLATRNGIARLRRAMVPPEVAVLELSFGIIDTKALAVVAELGIADQLADSPRTAAELASACNANEDALGRVLRYLVGRGLFRTTRGNRYRNNRASSLLRNDRPATLRPWARFFGSDWHVAIWNELESSVRTGGTAAEPALGHPFWEYVTETRPEAGEMFDEAMASVSSLQMEVIARKYDFKDCRRVCDVGGGTGTLLAAILNAHSHLNGVLFDLPTVVARAAPVLTAAGVADRVEVVGGDFFVSVPAGCDRYVLEAIVHDWDDESCVRFLSRCREAMPPDGRVLVLEQLVPKHSGDHPVKAIDLEMLVDTGRGRERTRAEFDVLFNRAGFAVRRVIPIALSSVFELVQAP